MSRTLYACRGIRNDQMSRQYAAIQVCLLLVVRCDAVKARETIGALHPPGNLVYQRNSAAVVVQFWRDITPCKSCLCSTWGKWSSV